MAAALSDLLAWPAATLTVSVRSDHSKTGWRDHVVHAWVRGQNNQGFDASGFFDEAEVHGTFLDDTGTNWRDARIIEHKDSAALLNHLAKCFEKESAQPGFELEFRALCQAASEVAEAHLLHLARPPMMLV